MKTLVLYLSNTLKTSENEGTGYEHKTNAFIYCHIHDTFLKQRISDTCNIFIKQFPQNVHT